MKNKNKPKIQLRVSESGNGYVLYLNQQIMNMYDLQKGSLVDISDMFKVLENVKSLPKGQGKKEIKEVLNNGK
jgi:hypothetical protein